MRALTVFRAQRLAGRSGGLGIRSERGSITAEFAMVLPAVFVVLACCVGGIRLVAVQLQLSDAASIAARIVARGETFESATVTASTVLPNARFSQRESVSSAGDSLVCVTATSARAPGVFGLVTITGSSCVLKVDAQ